MAALCMGWGAKSPKCRLASHREIYWSRIRMWIVRNFQILVVSAVKISKKCMQTASASGDPYRGFTPGPHSDPLGYRPQMKLPGAATDNKAKNVCLYRFVNPRDVDLFVVVEKANPWQSVARYHPLSVDRRHDDPDTSSVWSVLSLSLPLRSAQ